MLRLVEERVPALRELLIVLVHGHGDFFLGRIVVKDLLRLLLRSDHTFYLVQDVLIDVCHCTSLLLAARMHIARIVLLCFLEERLSVHFA